jgi:hypothetical protein
MSKTPLMEIVNAAAERFDKRPLYRASVEARAELQSTGLAPQVPATRIATTAATATATASKKGNE